MESKIIVFAAPGTAELQTREVKPVTDDLVAVRMEYTVVSGGTERACIMAMPNAGGKFPKTLGYCGVGHVLEAGEQVTSVKPIISRVVKPEEAPEIYTQLCDEPMFPMGTVFDWR